MRMRRLGLRALLLAIAGSVLLIAPVSAQDDPYGGTTTTSAPDGTLVPECTFTLDASAPGAEASLTVRNVPPGGTVRVLIGGVEAGRATAPLAGQSVGAPVLLGGQQLAAQAAGTTLVIPFTVPELEPGLHLVTAVGSDFTLTCDQEYLDILATSQTGGGDGGGTVSLPRTGIYVGLFLVIALALLLVGRALLKASRQRREEAERQARRAARASRHAASGSK